MKLIKGESFVTYTPKQIKFVKKYTGHQSVEEFLMYCEDHSRTEIAAFSPGQLFTIYSLGDPAEYKPYVDSWKEIAEKGSRHWGRGDFASVDLRSVVKNVRIFNT